MKQSARGIALPLIIVVGLILALGALVSLRPKTTSTLTSTPAPMVEAYTLRQQSVRPSIKLYADIESPYVANLTAPLTAYIQSTPVLEGEIVDKGALLVSLDTQDIDLVIGQRQADVNEINATIEQLIINHHHDKTLLAHQDELVRLQNKDVSREQHLVKTGTGSKARLDQALQRLRNQQLQQTDIRQRIKNHPNNLNRLKAQRARAQHALDQAQLDKRRSQIKAPFRARVITLHVTPGDRIQAGQPVIDVFDQNNIELRAQIPSRYINAVRHAAHTPDALSAVATLHDEHYALRLDRLAGEVGKGRAGIDGLFTFASQTPAIALGHTVPLLLTLPALNNVFLVPITALYDNQRIYRIHDNKLQSISVELVGYQHSGTSSLAIIKSNGLKTGDSISITHLPLAISGMQVSTQKENAKPIATTKATHEPDSGE